MNSLSKNNQWNNHRSGAVISPGKYFLRCGFFVPKYSHYADQRNILFGMLWQSEKSIYWLPVESICWSAVNVAKYTRYRYITVYLFLFATTFLMQYSVLCWAQIILRMVQLQGSVISNALFYKCQLFKNVKIFNGFTVQLKLSRRWPFIFDTCIQQIHKKDTKISRHFL
jgi:hypothetical protein